MSSDLISRQAAIDAIEEIRSCIWDVDIPSPTVPEYIEHHKQMQELMDRCDTLRSNLVNLPSAERKRAIWMPIERGDKGYSAGDFICSCCGKPNKCYSITDYCCSCGAKMERKRRKDVRESN